MTLQNLWLWSQPQLAKRPGSLRQPEDQRPHSSSVHPTISLYTKAGHRGMWSSVATCGSLDVSTSQQPLASKTGSWSWKLLDPCRGYRGCGIYHWTVDSAQKPWHRPGQGLPSQSTSGWESTGQNSQHTKDAAQQIAEQIQSWLPARTTDPDSQHEITQLRNQLAELRQLAGEDTGDTATPPRPGQSSTSPAATPIQRALMNNSNNPAPPSFGPACLPTTNPWLADHMPSTLAVRAFKKCLKDLPISDAKRTVLNTNIAKTETWWARQPAEALETIERVAVMMGIPVSLLGKNYEVLNLLRAMTAAISMTTWLAPQLRRKLKHKVLQSHLQILHLHFNSRHHDFSSEPFSRLPHHPNTNDGALSHPRPSSQSKAETNLEGCTDLTHLWGSTLTSHNLFSKPSFQSQSVYLRFTHIMNMQPKFYIGSAMHHTLDREYSRSRKFFQLNSERLVQADLALRYWKEHDNLYIWAPIPIRADYRCFELALIQEWQPRLNYPFICQFFHPRKGILKKPALNTNAQFGLATLWRRRGVALNTSSLRRSSRTFLHQKDSNIDWNSGQLSMLWGQTPKHAANRPRCFGPTMADLHCAIVLCSQAPSQQHPGAIPHSFPTGHRCVHSLVERETCTTCFRTMRSVVPDPKSSKTPETVSSKMAPPSTGIPSPMPQPILQDGVQKAFGRLGPTMQSQTSHHWMVSRQWDQVLLQTLVKILQGSPQSIRSPLVLAGSLLHDLLPADLAVIAEGSLLNKVFPSKKDYLLHTVEDRSPTLNQAKWPSFHAHSRHLRTEPGPMDTTHPSCHLSHHQVIHHCLPTIVWGRCLPLRRQTSFITQNLLSMPLPPSNWKHLRWPFHFRACHPGPGCHCYLSCWSVAQTTWQGLPMGHGSWTSTSCRLHPGKKEKAFQSGRPIISFVDSPFRPMLNILARMIFQLIPVACPNHLASGDGDVYSLLDILRSALVDADLILVNQDLAGFFTSIDQERFIGAWFMLLDFLRPHMNVADNEVFSVYPGKANNPGDLIKGRTFRRPNVTRKIVIKDVPSLLTTALEMQTFALGQHCIRQRRGSPMGSALFPALCLMVVSISEQIWSINFKQILSNHHFFIKHIRYVDNRLIFGDARLQQLPPYEVLLDAGIYGKPIILETEPDQEFLGFMLETKPLELIYHGPTNISQVLSPYSASPPKVLPSGLRSRCHIVVKGAFPDHRVQQGLDQLIHLYMLAGFPNGELHTISSQILTQHQNLQPHEKMRSLLLSWLFLLNFVSCGFFFPFPCCLVSYWSYWLVSGSNSVSKPRACRLWRLWQSWTTLMVVRFTTI